MDSGKEWRVIESDDEPDEHAPAGPESLDGRLPRWLLGAIVAVIGAACAFAIWATLPSGGVAVQASGAAFDPRVVLDGAATPAGSPYVFAAAGSKVVVDIEGAVIDPGVHELDAGSRVGDAIEAAGGYAANADIAAAARTLNLASKLTDGQQIRVPALGEQTAPTQGGGDTGGGAPAFGGLIDINHATAEQLDTLPGIGPVTAAKIIDARTEAPFASIDELQSRGVVGQSTFDKLRDLITAAP